MAAKAARVAEHAGKAGKVEKAAAAARKAEQAARRVEETARKNPTPKNREAAREARQHADAAHAAVKSAQVNKAIDDALESPDAEKRLEGKAADAVRQHAVDFNRKVRGDGTTPHGEIDVETRKTIIEVTKSKGGKLQQTEKYQTKLYNPDGKEVIIYVPNYSKFAVRDAERAGAHVARSPAELQALLQQLGEG